MASFLAKTLDSVSAANADAARRRTTLMTVVRKVVRYPLKMAALFIASPYLLFVVARSSRKHRLQRAIAVVGLFFAIVAPVSAFLFLGSFAGAVLMGATFGVWGFVGFLLGTTISVVLTVALCFWLMLFVSWVFLSMSSEDIVEALRGAAAAAHE